MTDNTKIKIRPVDQHQKPPRRKPVPIAGRISNSELQAEIDATLDIRIGGKKLRDCTSADLFRSAEQDRKDAKALRASAASMRAIGRVLKPAKS
jgi:hypothetical protein